MSRRITARIFAATAVGSLLSALAPAAALAGGGGEPAGGAPIGDIVWGTVVGGLLAACVAVVGFQHRRGRTRVLNTMAGLGSRISGFPGWYALPAAIAAVSLIVAVFGFYWDVATHIDNGRDPGAFGNAAHFPILIGLAGIALAGIVAVLLGSDQRDPAQADQDREVGRVAEGAGVATVVDVGGDVPVEAHHRGDQRDRRDRGRQRVPAGEAADTAAEPGEDG